MASTIPTVLAAVLLVLALAAPAAAAQLSVQFRTMRGHVQNMTMTIGAVEAARLLERPNALADQLLRARGRYANQLGYSEKVNGADFHKIVPGLRVEKIAVDGPYGHGELLRAEDPERDDEQDYTPSRAKHRARGAGTKKSGNKKKW